jgi:hypothetical protein
LNGPDILLLSVKAGLRAKEIARLRWEIVIDAAVPIIDAGVREWLAVEGGSNLNMARSDALACPRRISEPLFVEIHSPFKTLEFRDRTGCAECRASETNGPFGE